VIESGNKSPDKAKPEALLKEALPAEPRVEEIFRMSTVKV
jgi:hypothetical protein